jgi:choline dehydrogenase-like flavoprotein
VNTFDIIIIGSGAGGGTIARELASTGAKILIVERGDFIPQEDHNWNPASVWKDLRYRTTETWLDEAGRAFRPYTHYCVGGNTKFWGTVMYRLRPSDFKEVQHAEGISPAWPIDYDTLAPYYDRAEAMYEVHGEAGLDPTEGPRKPYPFPPVPHSKVVGSIVEQLKAQGLHPSPLPLGLRENCVFCNTCNSFPCKIHAKSDADVCGVRPATQSANVTLWTNAIARRLVTNSSGRTVEAVEIERDGKTETVSAPLVIVSCGAVNSAPHSAACVRLHAVDFAGMSVRLSFRCGLRLDHSELRQHSSLQLVVLCQQLAHGL